MAKDNLLTKFANNIFEKIFSLNENHDVELGSPKKFLVVRQHNQLGDLLAGVSLFRAIKETYPDSEITLIVSPFNYPGLLKNKYIDRLVIFDKKKIINPVYFVNFLRLLKKQYDVAVVPVLVSISFTSNLIAGISNAKIKIGAKDLDGKVNQSSYFFDRRVSIDWRKHPDSNVSERSLDIVRPFGITTNNFRSEISFDENDLKFVEGFLSKEKINKNELLIGLHVGAGKIPNRWSLLKYEKLINKINENYNVKFYLTGSKADNEEIQYLVDNIPFKLSLFINKSIPKVAALISLSDLFISNDTGIMHVAGTTGTPQISIFGPTNPYNWAPIGKNKYFIRKSELIDDISVQDVYEIAERVLVEKKNEKFAE